MAIASTIKKVINQKGTTQSWVIKRMNSINPDLHMNRSKFSAIVRGNRKMTGDELIAFCKAAEIDPDIFLEPKDEKPAS